MRSALPYRGYTNPQLRSLLREVFASPGILPRERMDWEHAVRILWDEAAYREERYAATILAAHRSARGWQDPDAMPLYEHLVVTGAWWDHVDDLATHHIAAILLHHKDSETARMRAWANADDLWLRRVAILCQLPFGADTDRDLLSYAIDANVEGTAYGREFFVRKAIGWALRQYARTDPDWVRAFVADRREVLSGLTVREALKHLG